MNCAAQYLYNERDLLTRRSLGVKPANLTPGPFQPSIAQQGSEIPAQEQQTQGGIVVYDPGNLATYLQNLDYTYNAQRI